MVDSGSFTGLFGEDGRKEVTKYLEANQAGRKRVTYRMRDWLISRQRYWGAPIPIIYCPKCGEVPVPDEDLPVHLPLGLKVTTEGPSPLARHESFINATCPVCGAQARRETDTIDTFVCRPGIFSGLQALMKQRWLFLSRELTIGIRLTGTLAGRACCNASFVLTVYYQGFVRRRIGPADEPFANLLTQGMVVLGGAKMSKSKGNVVSPDDIVRNTARM